MWEWHLATAHGDLAMCSGLEAGLPKSVGHISAELQRFPTQDVCLRVLALHMIQQLDVQYV